MIGWSIKIKKLVVLSIIDQLKDNLAQNLGLIQVILGPRQVGKTTTIIHFLEKEYNGTYLCASADKVFQATPKWIREQWQEARHKSCTSGYRLEREK